MIQYLHFEMQFPGEGERTLIVAFDEGRAIVGTVCLSRSNPLVGEFARLFVREDVRCEGIGRGLIERAAEISRSLGHTALSCSCHPKNARALRFYAGLGFSVAFQFSDGDLLMTRPILQPIVSQPAGGVL